MILRIEKQSTPVPSQPGLTIRHFCSCSRTQIETTRQRTTLTCHRILSKPGKEGSLLDGPLTAALPTVALTTVHAENHRVVASTAVQGTGTSATTIFHLSTYNILPHRIFFHGNIYLVALPLQTLLRKPSFWARRLRESSLSARERTKPHSAYTWFSPVYRPFSSTLPTLICTDAWSLALMMRLVAEHLRGT